MEYIRSQLMEDMYSPPETSTKLTHSQREAVQAIRRSQLQEDVYRSLEETVQQEN